MCKREYDGTPGTEDCKELWDSVVVCEIARYLNLERVVRVRRMCAGGGIGGLVDEVDYGAGRGHGWIGGLDSVSAESSQEHCLLLATCYLLVVVSTRRLMILLRT
jgi:hypothetical protein